MNITKLSVVLSLSLLFAAGAQARTIVCANLPARHYSERHDITIDLDRMTLADPSDSSRAGGALIPLKRFPTTREFFLYGTDWFGNDLRVLLPESFESTPGQGVAGSLKVSWDDEDGEDQSSEYDVVCGDVSAVSTLLHCAGFPSETGLKSVDVAENARDGIVVYQDGRPIAKGQKREDVAEFISLARYWNSQNVEENSILQALHTTAGKEWRLGRYIGPQDPREPSDNFGGWTDLTCVGPLAR